MSCKSVMKAWKWVLLFAVAVLFMWTAREGFQDTIALRGPPYGDSDYKSIVGMMPSTLVKALETANSAVKPVAPLSTASTADKARYASDLSAYHRKLADGKITDIMGDFHTSVYQPAKVPLKASDVNTFLATKATTGFLSANKADIKTLLVAYFVTQPAGAANTPLTAAQIAADEYSASTGYDDILKALGQGADDSSPPAGGSGSDSSSSSSSSSDSSSSSGSGSGSGSSSNTTGGSQTFRTSNSGNSKGNLWGPAFSGMGNNAGFGTGTGGAARDYPTLLGPKPVASTMVEGAGIMNPSQHETIVTSGVLPGAAGTGSDPNSQFFGSSRVPGDKDLFPNPYQEFTPSVGSSKTEPVPYLSDFSAFSK